MVAEALATVAEVPTAPPFDPKPKVRVTDDPVAVALFVNTKALPVIVDTYVFVAIPVPVTNIPGQIFGLPTAKVTAVDPEVTVEAVAVVVAETADPTNHLEAPTP